MEQASSNTQQIVQDIQLQSAKPTFDYNPGVDVCFMMDCTGSMEPYIEMVQNRLRI